MPNQPFALGATLLYAAKPRLDLHKILAVLNARGDAHNAARLSLSPLSTTSYAVITGANVHATLSVVATPAPQQPLRDALPDTASEPLCAVIDGHAAHLRIDVGDGDAPLPPQTGTDLSSTWRTAPACPAATKLRLLHGLLDAVSLCAQPGAMHVYPANRVLMPADLAALDDGDLPLPLLVRAESGDWRDGPGGARGQDIALHGAALLTGCTLTLEGAPQDASLSAMEEILINLLRAHLSGRATLSRGARLAPAPGMTLHVRRDPDAAGGPDRIVASLWPQIVVPVRVVAKTPARPPVLQGFQARIGRIAARQPTDRPEAKLPDPDLSGLIALKPQHVTAQHSLVARIAPTVMLAATALLVVSAAGTLLGRNGNDVASADAPFDASRGATGD